MDDVCDQLGLVRFSPSDELFVQEYCQVMKPVAIALDRLQGESSAYMGILLPTLHSLRRRLVSVKEAGSLTLCTPLVQSLINSLDTRFTEQWFRKDLVLAAALHPQFQFSWIMDGTKETQARQWLMEEVARSSPAAVATAEEDESEDEIFDFRPPVSANTTVSPLAEMNKFLSFPVSDIQSLHAYPTIKKLFLKYNTPIPSSAGVERVFSAGGLICSDRRGSLSDKNFENALLLKVGL